MSPLVQDDFVTWSITVVLRRRTSWVSVVMRYSQRLDLARVTGGQGQNDCAPTRQNTRHDKDYDYHYVNHLGLGYL